jgi:hypothetical protein
VVSFDCLLGEAQLLLHNLGFDAEIRQLVAQSLRFHAQCFALLFADFDLLIQHDGPLDGHIVLWFQVFQGRDLMACLALEIVVLHLNVAQLVLQWALRLAQGRDLLLEDVLGVVGLGLALLVFGLGEISMLRLSQEAVCTYLPLLGFEAHLLHLLLQLALALLALVNVPLQFSLQLLARRLELL